MAQSTNYSGSSTHDIKEKATNQFERMADKATDNFKTMAGQAEDAANRMVEHGREVGDRVQEEPGNFKGAVDSSAKDQPMATLAMGAVAAVVSGGVGRAGRKWL